MKALMSPFARAILRNPANREAVQKIIQQPGHGKENGVEVTLVPMDDKGNVSEPVTVFAYKSPPVQIK